MNDASTSEHPESALVFALHAYLRSTCTPATLRALASARLGADALAALDAHQDSFDQQCAEVARRYAARGRDQAFVDELLEHLGAAGTREEEELRRLAERARASADKLDPRRIALKLIVGMVAFTAVIAAIGFWLREPMTAAAELFVDRLGVTGVMLGFYFPDGFTIPMPPDAFSALGLAGGLNFYSVVFWSSLGSVLGGATGFTIGRRLSRTRWFRRKIQSGNGAAVYELIERYGALGLGIAACTPLPYSLATWAAGTTRMTYTMFFVISIPLRSVRVAGMLWLVDLGLKAGA